MTEEEVNDNQFPIWPDNVQAVNVFTSIATQWNVGMGGAVGLVYSSIEPALRLLKVPEEEWSEVFEDLRVLEDAALEQMRRKS